MGIVVLGISGMFLLVWVILVYSGKIKLTIGHTDLPKFMVVIQGVIWSVMIILIGFMVSLIVTLVPIKNGAITKRDSVFLEPFPNQWYFMIKDGKLSYYGVLNDKDKGVYTLSNNVRIRVDEDTTEILHLPILVTYTVVSKDSTV